MRRPNGARRTAVARLAGTALLATALVGTASGCGCGGDFALSLVSDRGGRPTPVAAAEEFATHGGVAGLPGSGWHEVGRDGNGATLRSDGATLHAAQGPDGTWQVDSGSC